MYCIKDLQVVDLFISHQFIGNVKKQKVITVVILGFKKLDSKWVREFLTVHHTPLIFVLINLQNLVLLVDGLISSYFGIYFPIQTLLCQMLQVCCLLRVCIEEYVLLCWMITFTFMPY